MENSTEVPQKLKTEVPYHPAIPFLGISEENENTNLKRYMHPYVHSSIIYNSQDRKQPESINRWMDKEDVRYIYIYTEWSKSDWERQKFCNHLYVQSKK